jgi:triosephosphate isomerase (TIM)
MKRVPFIAGNWKMNTTLNEAAALASAIRAPLNAIVGVEKAVCPPFISLAAVAEILKGSSVEVGAQGLFYEEKGAYTGEISPLMLKDLCRYCIIGHSERRQYFYDTEEAVNKKVRTALKAGIIPILCVGERLEEKESGRANEVIGRQLDTALSGLPDDTKIVIAYEPVWAIGTGRSASAEQANSTIGFIRNRIAGILGNQTAAGTRILYGGSVTPENIAGFTTQTQIDGALVGGASLKPEQFIEIVRRTAQSRGL